MGTVVQTGDLKFVKVNDNNLLVSLQSLTTTNGESPLSLPKSAGLNLSNYQIDGQTVQESPLPAGYTQVEYLQSTGTQYIDTGLTLTADQMKTSVLEAKMSFNSTEMWNVVGYGGGSGDRLYFGVSSTNYFAYSSDSYDNNTNVVSDTNVHNFILNNQTGTYTVDQTQVATFTASQSTNAVDSMLLFGYINATSGGNLTKRLQTIYTFKISIGSNLVRNFIPAIRTSDSVAGMYDTVNSVFYTNAGTGTFATGAAVTTPTPDVPWEIQNLGYENLLDDDNWYTILSVGSTYTTKTAPIVPDSNTLYVTIFFYAEPGTYTLSAATGFWSINRSLQGGGQAKGNSGSGSIQQYTFNITQSGLAGLSLEKNVSQTNRTDIPIGANTKPSDFGFMLTKNVAHPYVPYGTTGVQVQSVGKNIFPMDKWLANDFVVHNGTLVSKNASGITMTSTASDCFTGTYNMSATASDNQPYVENFGFVVQPGTTYTYSFNKTTANTSWPYVFYYDSSFNYLSFDYVVCTSTSCSLTFTTPANAAYATVRLGIDNSGVTETFSNIQVEQGATATAYQPYESHTYSIPFGKKNVNLFNYERISSSVTYGGVTLTNNNNGSFSVSCTACNDGKSTNSGVVLYDLTSAIKKNGPATYVISGGSLNSFPNFYVELYYNGSWHRSGDGYYRTDSSTQLTSSITEAMLAYSDFQAATGIYWPNNTTITEGLLYPQFEIGSVATYFQPYHIAGPLRCVGSGTSQVCDYIDFANQRVVRNVGYEEFDGTEGWSISPTPYASVFISLVANSYNYSPAISSHFLCYANFNNNPGYFYVNSTSVLFMMDKTLYTTSADFKAYLAAQYAAGTPVTVQYQLATPIYESIAAPLVETAIGNGSLYATDGTLQSSWIKTNYWWEK